MHDMPSASPVVGLAGAARRAPVAPERQGAEPLHATAAHASAPPNAIANSLAGNVTHVGRPVRSAGLLFPELSHAIVGAAIEVHKHIGPGQLESVYQRALGKELAFRKIPARAQVPIAMTYKGERVGDFFADFIVDDLVVVELKAVEKVHGAHVAQVLSYLRATELRLGLLINFNAAVLYRGVRRIVL